MFFPLSLGFLCFSLILLVWQVRKGKKLAAEMKYAMNQMLAANELLVINSELMARLEELGDKDYVVEMRVKVMKKVIDKFDGLL